jgi:hypothetical protein
MLIPKNDMHRLVTMNTNQVSESASVQVEKGGTIPIERMVEPATIVPTGTRTTPGGRFPARHGHGGVVKAHRAFLAAVFIAGSAGFLPAQEGSVLRTAVPAATGSDSIRAELWMPSHSPVQGVVVLLPAGDLAEYAFDNRNWRGMCLRARCALLRFLPPYDQALRRDAAQGAGAGLLALLEEFARRSGTDQLATAGVVLWGHSASGQFAVSFATWKPERTIGIIVYHGAGLGGVARGSVPELNYSRLVDVPALFSHNTEGAGAARNIQIGRSLVRLARERGAPWAFVAHPGPHNSVDGLLGASPLLLSWIEGVMRARAPGPGTSISSVAAGAGWLANDSTQEMAPAGRYRGAPAAAYWLPDAPSLLSWILMRGVCAAFPRGPVEVILGPGARVTGDDGFVCQYGAAAGADSTRIIVELNGRSTIRATADFRTDSAATFGALTRSELAAGRTAVTGLGDAAFTGTETEEYLLAPGITVTPNCRTFIAARGGAIFRTYLCGSGKPIADDHRALGNLLRALLAGL